MTVYTALSADGRCVRMSLHPFENFPFWGVTNRPPVGERYPFRVAYSPTWTSPDFWYRSCRGVSGTSRLGRCLGFSDDAIAWLLEGEMPSRAPGAS